MKKIKVSREKDKIWTKFDELVSKTTRKRSDKEFKDWKKGKREGNLSKARIL